MLVRLTHAHIHSCPPLLKHMPKEGVVVELPPWTDHVRRGCALSATQFLQPFSRIAPKGPHAILTLFRMVETAKENFTFGNCCALYAAPRYQTLAAGSDTRRLAPLLTSRTTPRL